MRWKGFGLTHIGKVRQMNQDALGLFDDLGLWIIADGMGGHVGGEIASQLAIDTIASSYETQASAFLNHPIRPIGIPDATKILRQTMEAANTAIRKHAEDNPEYKGMGTTAVAVHVSESPTVVATIAHTGDSRAYLIRNNTLSLLTRDHSLVEERIELGIITPEQALTHPLRHILTRALGIEPTVDPTLGKIELTEKDQLLLCTDGLTKMMTDSEILETILAASMSLEKGCEDLVKQANQQGGQDNVTVVMVGIE